MATIRKRSLSAAYSWPGGSYYTFSRIWTVVWRQTSRQCFAEADHALYLSAADFAEHARTLCARDLAETARALLVRRRSHGVIYESGRGELLDEELDSLVVMHKQWMQYYIRCQRVGPALRALRSQVRALLEDQLRDELLTDTGPRWRWQMSLRLTEQGIDYAEPAF